MFDETFARALLQKRSPLLARLRGLSGYTVLGFRLRPFSLWHEALLDALESPFTYWTDKLLEYVGQDRLFDGKWGDFNFARLYVATQICRLSWPHHLPRDHSYLRRILHQRKYWPRFPRELRAFSAYLTDYRSAPEIVASENANLIKTPWYAHTVAALRRLSPELTEAQAWNTAPGYARWKIIITAEAAGEKIDLVTPEDRAQCRELGIEI